MKNPVLIFTLATLTPLPLLGAAAIFGGVWALAACITLTLLVFFMDEIIGYAATDTAPGVEFPSGKVLSAALGIIHIPALIVAIAATSGATGLAVWEIALVFIAFGIWFGQVSYSNAHELIHRSNKWAFRLGALVYATTFYGHHVTAHRFIHHRFVGSNRDPNTARFGESFYRFAVRAWGQAYVEGARVETDMLKKRGGRIHPYVVYGLVNAAMLAAVYGVFGIPGVFAFLALSLYATMQILLADYVQHYGLERGETADGKLEPIDVAHSWNAPHPVSAALMLNAPRHSDHHAHPAKPFTNLELPDEADAPMLPASLPAMSAVALFPPIWHHIMDDRAASWRDADEDAQIAAQ